MSYSPAKGPRVIAGVIACSILALFLWLLASTWWPVVYGAYQYYRISNCEDRFGIEPSDYEPVFGFDYMGRKIVGDTDKKRSAIECVRSALDVYESKSRSQFDDGARPSQLEVGQSSFSNRVIVTYYPPSGGEDRR